MTEETTDDGQRAGSPSASMSAGAGSRRRSSTSKPAASARSGCGSRRPTRRRRTRSSRRSRGSSGASPSRAGSVRATPVGIGLPGVAIDGVLKTAANIDPAWIDFPVVERLPDSLKRPVFIINDADAAGIAEMRFGVGQGPAGRRHLPDPRDRASGRACSTTACSSRTPSSARWRSAAGPPRTPLRGGRADPARPVVEGLGGRPRRAPRPDRPADVAEPDHPGRRGQQERRQVHPAADGPHAGRRRPSCATTPGIIGAAIVAAEGWPMPPRRAATCRARRRRRPRRHRGPRRHRRRTPDHDDRPATAAPTTPRRRARMVIGGESVDAADGQTFDVVDPATGAVIATAPLGGRRTSTARSRRPAARLRRPQGLGELGRRQARPVAGQARGADQAAQRGAGPAREPQRRQADHAARAARSSASASSSTTTRAPRTRSSARRSRSPSRPRPDPARADRRRRAHRALELPAADGLLEGRAGPRRRQYRDPQARAVLPADGDPPRRAGARGRASRRVS